MTLVSRPQRFFFRAVFLQPYFYIFIGEGAFHAPYPIKNQLLTYCNLIILPIDTDGYLLKRFFYLFSISQS